MAFSLSRGATLGHYEVKALLGKGGMGEVWRAQDTRLGREVAIKALPPEFSEDVERLARFEREAQLLAALNHPNIAIIHDLKEVDGSKYLILELVEGDTLADRIVRGPLPIDEALDIAQQVADALEAAHEKGIVHRDLKPANVKVTPDGRVKVLDFGLAKMHEAPSAVHGLSQSPTLTAMHTGAGVILGTVAYMSPEQARGRNVDRRSDIWAFGCVLYEMLTGRRAFVGEDSVSDTVAEILKSEPAWSALPAGTPQKIRTLLDRCLRKDVRRRLPDIGEARIEIEEARSEPLSDPQLAAPAAAERRRYLWPALAVLSLLAAVVLAGRIYLPPASRATAVRFEITAPPGAIQLSPSLTDRTLDIGRPLSPDGRKLAFVANVGGTYSIWIRWLDSPAPQPLPGTEDATRPVWSPDSEFLAFFAQGKLKKVAIAGGPPSVIADSGGRDAAWGPDGVLLIGGQVGQPILRVSAAGGQPTPATELASNETTHDYPDFLPDGRRFLYLARHGAEQNEWDLVVGSLDSKERVVLPGIHAGATYSPSGHLLFVRDRTLMVQPFDLDRLTLTREAFALVEDSIPGPRQPFSMSTDGSLAYMNALPALDFQLAWFDRTGKQVGTVGPMGRYRDIALSPDGRHVAFLRGLDVFLHDLDRGLTSQFTSNPALDFAPVWSPNGEAIAFASSRDPATNAAPVNRTAGNLYQRLVGVVADDQLLFKSNAGKVATDWSDDGRYVAYISGGDVWALPMPMSGDGKPLQVTETPSDETSARFSPDGRWIAYQSGTQPEVYVQSFPQRGANVKVSVSGGTAPRWAPDGKELYYIAPHFTLMAVPINVTGSGLRPGSPAPLFQSRAFPGIQEYDVSRDGRFLLNVPANEPAPNPVTVILNWTRLLEKSATRSPYP